jgi:hypothetical protein
LRDLNRKIVGRIFSYKSDDMARNNKTNLNAYNFASRKHENLPACIAHFISGVVMMMMVVVMMMVAVVVR